MAKTTPLTPVLAAEDAEFVPINGWERAEYFKPRPDFHVSHGFHFDESHAVVAEEVAAVQNAVGLAEVNGFNRFEITGSDAHSFLDRMICGRLPRKPGRVGLAYLLNQHGMVKTEATIANLPASNRGIERIWYGSAAAAEFHDMDWLMSHIGPEEDVQIKSLTNDQTILVLAGPHARAVLSKVSRADWSREAFPWLSVRECFVGIAPATVMAVSFSGELAYEIHIPNASLYAAYLALRAAGAEHGLRLFGALAVESMRLEKGYLHWKSDLLTEFDPFETGLARFVDLSKSQFVGKDALQERAKQAPSRNLTTLVVDHDTASARPGASVMQGQRVVGTVTSGGYGHRTEKNIAYAFVDSAALTESTPLAIDILGEITPAHPVDGPLYDPELLRPRS